MPVCEGRPDESCPNKKNDKSVHLSQGDLMLCDACERYRFPEIFASTGNKKNATVSRGTAGAKSVQFAASSVDGATTSVHQIHAPIEAQKIIVNELLTYLCFYRNSGNITDTKKTLSCYYLPEEISNAKHILLNAFESTLHNSVFATKRRESSARSQVMAELDDIAGACDYLDKAGLLTEVQFVAVKLDRLPRCGPEELNLYSINERQNTFELNVNAMQQTLCAVESNINDIHVVQKDGFDTNFLTGKFEEFNSHISAQLDHMQQVCTAATTHLQQTCQKLADQVSSISGQFTHETSDNVDRSLNIVLFGVDENKDANIWRKKIDDVFQSLVGHSIDIVDMFRLGRYLSNKTRPVLIKLRSVWDCRLLLSSSRKLKGTRMFLARDEPVEVRRKATMERIKHRAEVDGKHVCVIDGQLIIDGTAVYSIVRGSLNRDYFTPADG